MRLGVNIDHVATLRQARGTAYPNVVEAGLLCVRAGAHGITVHLREDRRHIQDADVYRLRKHLSASLNLEMANVPEIVAVALKVRPEEVCIVPEKRAERTTEGGLDVVSDRAGLAETVDRLAATGIRVSLFIAADADQVAAAADTGAPVIELHTGTYCDAAHAADRKKELTALCQAAEQAHELGLQVNAGHGLTVENLPPILRVPHLDTLNIGHSIVARSVFIGLEAAVREMLGAMGAALA